MDLALKRELRGDVDQSKSDVKKHMDELQDLGEALMTLRKGLYEKLDLPEKLHDALAERKRLTNFEAIRRQGQFIGKLMRKLDEDQVQAIRNALQVQAQGSAQETQLLHHAEHWRNRMLAHDDALTEWREVNASADMQQLRSWVRQARKDAQTLTPAGQPAHGKAYKDLFQHIRKHLAAALEQQHMALDASEDDAS